MNGITENEKFDSLEKTMIFERSRISEDKKSSRNRIFTTFNFFCTLISTAIILMIANGEKIYLEWAFFWILPFLVLSIRYKFVAETFLFQRKNELEKIINTDIIELQANKANGVLYEIAQNTAIKERAGVIPENPEAMEFDQRGNKFFRRSLSVFVFLLICEGILQTPIEEIITWLERLNGLIFLIISLSPSP